MFGLHWTTWIRVHLLNVVPPLLFPLRVGHEPMVMKEAEDHHRQDRLPRQPGLIRLWPLPPELARPPLRCHSIRQWGMFEWSTCNRANIVKNCALTRVLVER